MHEPCAVGAHTAAPVRATPDGLHRLGGQMFFRSIFKTHQLLMHRLV
jgi:hypothetical protein